MTETAQQYCLPAPDGAATAQPQAPPVYLNPAAHTELGQLLGRLATAKAAVTEAEAARDAIIADIKAMGVRYARQVNGGTIPGHIRFPGTPGHPPWDLDWVVQRRFSTGKFQADYPDLYERYRYEKGSWVLGPGG